MRSTQVLIITNFVQRVAFARNKLGDLRFLATHHYGLGEFVNDLARNVSANTTTNGTGAYAVFLVARVPYRGSGPAQAKVALPFSPFCVPFSRPQKMQNTEI